MYYFKDFLKELSVSTNMTFSIEGHNKEDIYYCGLDVGKEDSLCTELSLGEDKYILRVKKSEKACLSILKYYIENKYSELFCLREQFFTDIIQGNKVYLEKINAIGPFLKGGCCLMIINVDGSKYEALNILKERYDQNKITSMIYDEFLIVIGMFENKKLECKRIKELLSNKLCCKCSISYGHDSFNVEDFKVSYEEAKDAMILGEKISNKDEVYSYNEMFFEKVIFSINDDIKKQYLNEFKETFDSLDEEMINTIEEFINCNLNISESAKNLYIHRNTLIYRLDKLTKDTNYDIRIFKDATVFTIAFLIWKGSK